jgi:hypothetical protein
MDVDATTRMEDTLSAEVIVGFRVVSDLVAQLVDAGSIIGGGVDGKSLETGGQANGLEAGAER